MFSNLKTKKRLTQLLIAVVAVALTVTGSVALFSNLIPDAKAAVEQSVTDLSSWNTAVNSGTEVAIRLDADITEGANSNHYEVPAGKKVTLNLNGHTLKRFSQINNSGAHVNYGYGAKGDYQGLIVNKGELTITGGEAGKGKISQILICNSYDNNKDRSEILGVAAAIVNAGTLTIESGITVENIFGQEHTKGNNMQDLFIYSHGILNRNGTVNTAAVIHAGAYAQGVSDIGGLVSSEGSYVSAVSYGIFGGTVNVTGGKIYSEAMSGAAHTGAKDKTHVWNFAVGVYSNNAVIKGNSSIETKATSWGGTGSSNKWGEATNMSWGVGVMYSDAKGDGTAAPVIGPDVNISASYYQNRTDDKETISFPTMNGMSSYISGSQRSPGSPSEAGKIAYAVAGIGVAENAAMYGGQSSEKALNDSSVFGAGTKGTPKTTYYRTEYQSYHGGLTASSDNYSTTSINSQELKTSNIKMGAPGDNKGGQYVVFYRYRNVANKITEASVNPNESINSKLTVSPATGTFTNLISVGGGEVINPNFYEFLGTYSVPKSDGNYGSGVVFDNPNHVTVTTPGTRFDTSFTAKPGNSYIIFADYQLKGATNVNVVADTADISTNTTNTEVSVAYTGNPIVPGIDFKIGVIDIKYDSIGNNNFNDYKVATDRYAVKTANEDGKLKLEYSYSTDGASYTSGLPTAVGEYTIKVVVPDDTNITIANAGNRNGGTFYLTLKITKATPSISGDSSKTGTYGQTISQIVPVNGYKAMSNDVDITSKGEWSFVGYANTDCPATTVESVKLQWTPTGANANNYNSQQIKVNLTINKRAVAVTPAASTVNYGAAAPAYDIKCNPAVSDSEKAAWLAGSAFEVNYNGTWQTYSSAMVPGQYDIRINDETFGGDTVVNNAFTIDGTAKLTINKAPLYYTATAVNKVYDGNAQVVVNLEYSRVGAVNGDVVSMTLATTGTLDNANAGENKAVSNINTDIDYLCKDKYNIVIQNNPTATVSKATPTATAKTYSFDAYDADRTLAKIDLTGESSVAGTWSWADATIVPSVNKTEYKAYFTPANENYNRIEVPVTIVTAKKVVTVSVEDKTVTYGSAAPALNLVYTGFTGGDNEFNVDTTGAISATPDYSMGKSVGTYPITITMSDYEAVNYEFVAATDCKVTVVKKNITITAPSTTVTYGDAKPAFLVSQLVLEEDALYSKDSLADLNSQAQFSITTDYTKGSPVADYAVTVSAAAAATNYEFTFVNGTVKVDKAVLTVTADNKTITFGDAAPYFTYTLSGWVTDDRTAPTGTPDITTAYVSGNDAGQYAISIEKDTLAHPNYTFNVVGGTLTVNKLSIDTSGVTVKADIVHGSVYSTAVFTESSIGTVPGTFVLKDANAVADYTKADNPHPILGNYMVVTGIFTPTDSDNYYAVEVDVNLYIDSCEISGKPVITGTAMAGNAITASVAGMNPNNADSYEFTWYVGSLVAGSGATYTVKNSDIGKSIYVVVTAIENTGYEGSAQSAAVTAVDAFKNIVSKAQLDITGISDAYIYDRANHGATVAVKSEYAGLVSNNIKVYYNGQETLPYNAGTYIVTVDVATPDVPSGANKDNYYGPVSGLEIGTITIAKAPYTATFEVADKIYDGTRKVEYYKVVPSGKIAGDDVYHDESLVSVVFAKANAGTHNIDVTGLRLVGDDAANYTLVIDSTTATINKKVLYATAEGVERQFNGSAGVDVRFTVDAKSYAAIDSATTVYVASATAKSLNVNAGTWKITDIKPVLGGASADNYTLEIVNENNAFVTILKADLVVEAPVVSGDDLVYNADRKLSNIDLEKYYVKDGTGTWVFDNPDTVPTVRKTQYAATFVVPEDSNYNSYKTNITVVIKPKTVVLKAKDVTVSYGKAASYGVEYSGFTGTDSLLTMGGTQPSFTCEYVVGANVGDYTIKLNHNLDSNGNYEFAVETGTLKVVPAELYATATATDRPYNGSNGVEVKFSITSGLYANDKESDVKLSTAAATGVASSANAGTRIVSYTAPTLTGVKAKNYKLVVAPASGVLTVNISKLDPEGYVFPSSATVPFGYALSWAEFSNEAAGDGTFAFTKNNEIPAALGSNYSYEVTFTPTDAVNYNTVTKYIPLTVTECAVNYVAGISGKAQVGQKLSVSFTGLPSKAYDYVNYQWYRNTDNGPVAISGANASTYTLTESDVGYEILCFTYFNAGDPFVFDEGIADIVGDREGIFGATSGSVAEENLTFWQRLVRWIENIIQALQGIMWGLGM